MARLLAARQLVKRFGGVSVLDSLDINVEEGSIKGIIGPNGAGKTTLFNLISGLEKPDSGKIFLKGREITGFAPERIAGLGIARTFQSVQLFERLNIIENIMVGRYLKTKVGFFTAGFWTPGVYREEHTNMVEAYGVLEFLGLYDKAHRKINQVSYMERKLVEIGRAMAMEPRLMLLDEPFGGLNAKERKAVAQRIVELQRRGISVVVIDHQFGIVSEISHEISVLHQGKIIAKGTAEQIRKDETVTAAYFFNGDFRYQ